MPPFTRRKSPCSGNPLGEAFFAALPFLVQGRWNVQRSPRAFYVIYPAHLAVLALASNL